MTIASKYSITQHNHVLSHESWQARPAYIDMCELNHTKRKLEFIVIFVRDLKAISGSSRQFDSVVPSIEPMETR